EKLLRESKTLKQKVELLDKENAALKKSLFDLSLRYNALATRLPKNHNFNLFGFLDSDPASETDAGNGSDVGAAAGASGSPSSSGFPGKLFTAKHEFKNHSGAVYAVQFSPSGKLLATGSFDKTVRIFDPIVTQKEIHCFKKHTLNVSDLGWTADSTELLSGAYDQTCKIWDVESGKLMESYDCDGFVQSIMSYQRDKNIFFHGTSRNVLAMIDRRNADVIFRNDAMINSLYILRDGLYVITCDSLGFIKTWDIRSVKCVYSHKSSPTGSPISHLAMCYTTPSMDEDPRFLAANSYDNVIRVYDRGFQPPKFSYRQTDALKGHKNKNWPIKSSFYYSQDGSSATSGLGISTSGGSNSSSSGSMGSGSGGGSSTGGELLQRLEGHGDRVYAVNFHPYEPILASCSADFTVKLWFGNFARLKA
ncbi:WD40-repeat-containing domain protein, partial [Cladochytrium replicatum]